MANFPMQEMLKYGWVKGKGLGKNENGIRIPVKLMPNQNKTGIGYDEHKPWWDRVYNDTVKNIKTECNDEKFSLMSVADTATSKTSYQNFWKKSEIPSEQMTFEKYSDSKICGETCECMITQTELCYDKIIHLPPKHNFTSNGKLERIAQQDALYLNTNPLLSDSMVDQKNDIDRNEKSDRKNMVLSKEIAKYNKKISTLMELSILEKSVIHHLEKNNNRMQNYLDMKKKVGAQRMKKDKHKEKKNLKKMMSLYNSMTSDALHSTNEVKITGGLFYQHTRLIQDKLLKIKKKSIDQTSDILPDVKLLGLERREKGKDSIEHKVDQSLKMETVINNKADESFKKDWTIVDFAKTDKERENFDCKAIFPSKAAIDRRKFEKEKAKNKYNNPIEEINLDFCCLSLKKKRTRKNLHPPSKGITKITEKLRSEALANELNSAIQKLTIFEINSTDKLNANTVKKKLVVPTQTHFMPV